MTSKTRNTDRRSGKAYGKGHEAAVKVLTPEQQTKKTHKDAERARKLPVSHVRGSNLTMPNFTWDWAAETISGSSHLAKTRRFRTVEAVLARARNGE